jgi:hypothetical protein
MVSLATNALEVYSIPPPVKTKEQPEAARAFALDLPGHRTDVRAIALSSDDQLIASASNGRLLYITIYANIMKVNTTFRLVEDMERSEHSLYPYL